MLWVYDQYKYIDSYSAGSESDVYRRQILTTKVNPRAVRVNPLTAGAVHRPIRFLHFFTSALRISF